MRKALRRGLLLFAFVCSWLPLEACSPGGTPAEASPGPAGRRDERAASRLALDRIGDEILDLNRRSWRVEGGRDPFERVPIGKETMARAASLSDELSKRVDEKVLDRGGKVDVTLCRLLLADVRHRVGRVLETESRIEALVPMEADLLALDPRPRYLPPSTVNAGKAALDHVSKLPMPPFQALHPTRSELRDTIRRVQASVERCRAWGALAEGQGRLEDKAAKKTERAAIARLSVVDRALTAQEKKAPQETRAGVGRKEFVWLLRHRHMIEATPKEIAKRGKRLLAQTQDLMTKLVARIEPGKSVAQALDELKAHAPKEKEIPALAYRAMTNARAFVISHDLVAVPKDLRGGMVVTASDAMAKSYPFGAFGGFEWVAGRMLGKYIVSPGASWMTPEQQAERLKGNDPFKIRVVAAHEMWPGHRLQMGYAAENPDPLRRAFSVSSYVEGWGLYSENLMYRHGYYHDPRTRLAELAMRRWRCVRMVLDPSLQLGWMSKEQAVDYLVAKAGLERVNAQAEVRRYLANPTRPLSYIWGWLEIKRMRKDCMAAGMSEKEFHDRFLSAGAIPLPLVRELLLGGPPPRLPHGEQGPEPAHGVKSSAHQNR